MFSHSPRFSGCEWDYVMTASTPAGYPRSEATSTARSGHGRTLRNALRGGRRQRTAACGFGAARRRRAAERPGDLPSLTFVATANAIAHAGATPFRRHRGAHAGPRSRADRDASRPTARVEGRRDRRLPAGPRLWAPDGDGTLGSRVRGTAFRRSRTHPEALAACTGGKESCVACCGRRGHSQFQRQQDHHHRRRRHGSD